MKKLIIVLLISFLSVLFFSAELNAQDNNITYYLDVFTTYAQYGPAPNITVYCTFNDSASYEFRTNDNGAAYLTIDSQPEDSTIFCETEHKYHNGKFWYSSAEGIGTNSYMIIKLPMHILQENKDYFLAYLPIVNTTLMGQ